MTTRELIQAEIGKIPEDRLEEVYGFIRSFTAKQSPSGGPGFIEKLREIRIEAPADFAANLDLYLSGEKSVCDDVH